MGINGPVVVIGSNSFSGAYFCSYALRQGADVIGMSRSVEPHRSLLPYRWENDSRFRFMQLDLNHDLNAIMEVIKREKPSVVINFAAQSMVAQSWENPDHWFMTNVVSTVRLHDRLRHCDFLDRYVHVTTPEVYGSTQGFIREDAPFNPSTPYAVSRAAADMSLQTFHSVYDFPVVSTRAANVYGPGQQLYRIVPRTMLYIRLGKKLSLHGGGVSRRSFIHMEDVSSATWKIMTDGKPGSTYHISTNEIVSIRNLVERICTKLGANFEECVEVGAERPGKDAAYQLDSSLLRTELSWQDEVSLDQGIEACAEWLNANLGDLKKQSFDYEHKP